MASLKMKSEYMDEPEYGNCFAINDISRRVAIGKA
jgi:hypothetical protein